MHFQINKIKPAYHLCKLTAISSNCGCASAAKANKTMQPKSAIENKQDENSLRVTVVVFRKIAACAFQFLV